MESILLFIMILLTAGTVHSDECDSLLRRTSDQYESRAAGLAAVRTALACSAEHLSAAIALKKIQMVVEEELKRDSQNLPLIRIKARVMLDKLNNINLSEKFEERAKRIERNMNRSPIQLQKMPVRRT